jgi:hypothetical protein
MSQPWDCSSVMRRSLALPSFVILDLMPRSDDTSKIINLACPRVLEPIGDSQTKVTVFNSFAGHGFGKVIVGFARRAAAKDADAFAQRIKAAVEAS